MNRIPRFPFGALVHACGANEPDQSDAFLLGAYPSAVHVRWSPPAHSGHRPVNALAVGNEPEVFWQGADSEERVERWKAEHFDPAWGEVTAAALNGPSGAWLQTKIIEPLTSAGMQSRFATDCLTTYRLSDAAADRITDTYEPFAATIPELEPAVLEPHPTESQIVREALNTQADRLAHQVSAARPTILVTLGNAAARVVASLAGAADSGALSADTYGTPRAVTIGGVRTTWLAAVHPATPAVWQARHATWLADGGFGRILQ